MSEVNATAIIVFIILFMFGLYIFAESIPSAGNPCVRLEREFQNVRFYESGKDCFMWENNDPSTRNLLLVHTVFDYNVPWLEQVYFVMENGGELR